jgi:RNA polymerase sigma-70 factor (ECF subfamily)
MPTRAAEAGRLLVAARAGDPATLGRLMEMFRSSLRAVADRELSPNRATKAAPSDVVQEVFLEAQRLFARFEGVAANEFRAWLRAILRNKISELRNRFRAGKRSVARERPLSEGGAGAADALAAEVTSPSSLAAEAESRKRVTEALARIPDASRQLIVWRVWEGLTFAEIGRRTSRSEDAVRMSFGRALVRLGEEMGRADRRPDRPGRA